MINSYIRCNFLDSERGQGSLPNFRAISGDEGAPHQGQDDTQGAYCVPHARERAVQTQAGYPGAHKVGSWIPVIARRSPSGETLKEASQ